MPDPVRSDRRVAGKPSLQEGVARRLRWLLIAFAALSGLSLGGRLNWLFDNLTAFVPQFAALAALFAIIFGFLKAPRWALTSLVLAVVHGARLWQPSSDATGHPGPTVKLVSANVKTSNQDYESFLRFIEQESPDLLAVIEIDDGWEKALETLSDEYPHRVVEPRIDNFGIAMLSRLPLSDARIEYFGDAGVPTIVASLSVDDGDPITVVATHPLPPVRSAVAAERNRQLAAVAQFAARQTGEVVVIGDLNVSPWSPYFALLLRESNLHDSRRGFALQPTWPTYCPPCMTPIDHVLTSGRLTVPHRQTGPSVGSDHLPIVATIGRRAD